MSDDPTIRDVVKTRSLLIYDDSDRVRMDLSAYGDVEPKISIYKEDGTPALEISSVETDKDSRRIILYGKGHKWRLIITSSDVAVGATLFDNGGKIIGAWGANRNDETGKYEIGQST